MIRIRILTNKILPWKKCFNVIFLWEFASAVTPGVVGGVAVAMFILEKEKIPLGKSTALVIITTILDNFFYIFLLPVLFLFVSPIDLLPANLASIREGGMTVFWIGYSIITAINLLLLISIFIYPKLFGKLALFIYRLPLLKRRKHKAEKFAHDIEIASIELKRKTIIFWIKLFLATIWSWTSRYLVINFVLLAFIELNLFDNFIILGRQLVMWLVMLVTPTPGGSGMAEYLFGELLSDYIRNGALALSLAFLWRLISYYPYLIIGSIILPRWMGRRAEGRGLRTEG
ncbi:MAG: flippase-like domain-containing protein [Crocinitomicaceae bacterium]|nr:flippase-like domain-containing protein [Crocinitomicaceae bacterium]